MENKEISQAAEGSSGSETRNRKLNNSDKANKEIQEAWKEFTKDSEMARKEINEAFNPENKDWSCGRLSIVVLITVVVATGVGALIKFLTW